jgi:LmbE family N-acetylglucosaminyl deacetylase
VNATRTQPSPAAPRVPPPPRAPRASRIPVPGAGCTPERVWRTSGGLDALPWVTIDDLLPAGTRLVVVAPHPDDEVLGCGGLLALAAAAGHPACVVAVTDGEASHPGSPLRRPERLRALRPRESRRALRGLGDPEVVRLHLPDGAVSRDGVRDALGPLIRGSDLVVTTWRGDGHPDHEETGHGVAAALGAVVPAGRREPLEVGVWLWDWAAPADPRVPWGRMRRLALPPAVRAAKRRALRRFTSQITPDPATGAPPVVPARMLAYHGRPFETYLLP